MSNLEIISCIIVKISLISFQVETFVVMYKTHCQCILDTVINANFDEVTQPFQDHVAIANL